MTKNEIFEQIKESNINAMASLLMGDHLKAIGFMKDQTILFQKITKKWENNND